MLSHVSTMSVLATNDRTSYGSLQNATAGHSYFVLRDKVCRSMTNDFKLLVWAPFGSTWFTPLNTAADNVERNTVDHQRPSPVSSVCWCPCDKEQAHGPRYQVSALERSCFHLSPFTNLV